MKRCLICDARIIHDNWSCSNCGWVVTVRDSVPIFAPHISGVSEGYDPFWYKELANLEDGNFWFLARNRLIKFLMRKHLPSVGHYLEIGCGTGFVLRMVQRTNWGWNISASEAHFEGIKFAKSRVNADVNFYQMDACAIPFSDEFDAIGAFDVLEHIRDDVKAISEVYAALKPGGYFVVSVPQHMFLWSKYDEASHHFRRYGACEIQKKLESAGFSIRASTSFNALLLPLMMLSRAIGSKRDKGNKDVLADLRQSSWANLLLSIPLWIEYLLLRLGIRFPFGGSRILVAQKNFG